jgi:hypothetical protein
MAPLRCKFEHAYSLCVLSFIVATASLEVQGNRTVRSSPVFSLILSYFPTPFLDFVGTKRKEGGAFEAPPEQK